MQRGLLLFVLGIWCGGSVFMWLLATQNFAVAKALQETPAAGFAQVVSGLDAEAVRLATRHQAGEVNRIFFDGWGMVQIPIALAALGLAWASKSSRAVLVMIGVMALIVFVFQLYVVPQTIQLGRAMDFAPREPPPPQDAMFWTLHHTYTGLDMLKFLLGLATAGLLLRKSRVKS